MPRGLYLNFKCILFAIQCLSPEKHAPLHTNIGNLRRAEATDMNRRHFFISLTSTGVLGINLQVEYLIASFLLMVDNRDLPIVQGINTDKACH